MKKKIFLFSGIFIGIMIVGLLLASNYFYQESVQRSGDVELHSEDTDTDALADPEDQQLLEEAQDWYDEQEQIEVALTSFDDLQLAASFMPTEGSDGNAVILAHGYRSQKENMDEYVEFYHDQGFDVLKPDARGHGESEGDYIGFGWHDRLDYLDWIDMLIDEHNAENILLHGESMGAATVLMASGEDLPDEVRGIVADSAYTTVEEELTHQLQHLYGLPAFPLLNITSLVTNIRAGYTFTEASTIEQIKANTLPLFLIHGSEDELVPTDMADELYEAAGGEPELWIVPDAGHTEAYTVTTMEFQERLQTFIEDIGM
ncbi:alpha/beta hydrolase [Salicibibacter cibi]|uniref:Alpha/beta hydrolase n=1 Tax=Salicibibacter cibi TaxID=2743001 RepID=A0A7T6Z9X1_9BACI|nr:alpha/beta hydrolase [Salicibibacter cibi]QQK79584.1 alpha/beta hydrolase [Salicibibacter cibi]